MLYYENSNGKLYLGDVIETIKNEISDKSVDIILTSPPYNINYHHTGNKKTGCYKDNIPEKEYQNWQIDVLKECYRVLKDGGSMLYNHKNRIKNKIQIEPYRWLYKTDFIIKQEIVWINRSQNFDKIRLYPWTERVYWLVKDKTTKMHNNINHSDVFDWNEWKAQGSKGDHTKMFPIQMPLDLLNCFPESKIVLDPFIGAGTTAKAAESLGKNWIGIDIDQKFCDMTIKRIND